MKKNFLILLSLIAVFSVLFTFAAFADTEAVADDTAAVSDSVAADDTAADTEAAADDTAADTEAAADDTADDTEAVVTDEHGHAADVHNTTGTIAAPTATWSNLGTSGIIGIVVAAVILVAVIVAIIVLVPKKSGAKK